ncbi:hypothetical protein Agub_g15439 [Astrephomene gubernaculifera]|uniref:Uncharacterized protein n=1 Tax=Astrephomene gubernaculifera TaxID=47775 RepID=A0AAD3E6W2_9CHLO|nr:hypothetical protein Agub_g15439 [Astrephomene gubernaculifera]
MAILGFRDPIISASPYAAPYAPIVQPLLFILWACFTRAHSQGLTCKPQEGLPLTQPYPPAYFQAKKLPGCPQYSCSCCNLTHGLSLHRALRAAAEDPGFSRPCAAWLGRMACRVCDPEVGPWWGWG